MIRRNNFVSKASQNSSNAILFRLAAHFRCCNSVCELHFSLSCHRVTHNFAMYVLEKLIYFQKHCSYWIENDSEFFIFHRLFKKVLTKFYSLRRVLDDMHLIEI